jgi:hypothetical protein
MCRNYSNVCNLSPGYGTRQANCTGMITEVPLEKPWEKDFFSFVLYAKKYYTSI